MATNYPTKTIETVIDRLTKRVPFLEVAKTEEEAEVFFCFLEEFEKEDIAKLDKETASMVSFHLDGLRQFKNIFSEYYCNCEYCEDAYFDIVNIVEIIESEDEEELMNKAKSDWPGLSNYDDAINYYHNVYDMVFCENKTEN